MRAIEEYTQVKTACKMSRPSMLSSKTLLLFRKRKEFKEKQELTQDNKVNLSNLNREIKNKIKRDLGEYKKLIIETIMAGNKSIKEIRKGLSGGNRCLMIQRVLYHTERKWC